MSAHQRPTVDLTEHREVVCDVRLVAGGRLHALLAPTVGIMDHVRQMARPEATTEERIKAGLAIVRLLIPTATEDEINQLDLKQLLMLLDLVVSAVHDASPVPATRHGTAVH